MHTAHSNIPQRHTAAYPIAGAVAEIKQRMLDWASQFSILLFLDSNEYRSPYSRYECLLATGCREVISTDGGDADALPRLQQLHDTQRDWLFGHIGYDYKNALEPKLSSQHTAKTKFPELHFFVPQTVCYIAAGSNELTISSYDDPAAVYAAIMAYVPAAPPVLPKLQFSSVVDKDGYIATLQKLRTHIADGDCYEINFCTEGFCEHADVVPLDVFKSLNRLSPAPFAAYYRLQDQYMMCASPERYLAKQGSKLLTQPIKGTARRDADPAKDEAIKEALRADIKERAENVMIVDLMRNDLAHVCTPGSVQVDELYGIYTFPQVHQMISTVSGTMQPAMSFTEALRHSFPMGSMTGAPKHKVMQLIERYERSRRELFSGTVGYITPDGDMDLNVVIRSMFYNSATGYLSYQTGGAITYDSDPAKEWDEMRLKAWALERIFS